MRFDYLRSARPALVQGLLDIRIPERYQSVLLALAGAVIVIAGACAIEAYRLREALRIQAVYQQRYDATQSELERLNVYYDRVRSAVELDKRVRRIAESGDNDARTLAEIANRLPRHAWLMGISHDASGLNLQGHAENLSVLSAVMRGLLQARRLHRPTLISAQSDEVRGRNAGMNYEIHVDGTTK